jgi:hypothetical protein
MDRRLRAFRETRRRIDIGARRADAPAGGSADRVA